MLLPLRLLLLFSLKRKLLLFLSAAVSVVVEDGTATVAAMVLMLKLS